MILILVDDEKQSLSQLDAAVSRVLPHAVRVCFHSTADALEYIRSNPVDVALLGVPMQDGAGIPLARTLQQHHPRANILFCSSSSEYAMEAWEMNCSGYLLKPISEHKIRRAMDNLRYPIQGEKRVVFRCFGNFEAYCDGTPIWFKYNRTKELLAYLVDRNGVSCSMKELAGILFEDDRHRSYLYQIRLDLVNTLGQLGVADILIQSRGYLGIAREKVSCDYFDFLDHKIQAPVQEYMTQYSFSEQTYGTLFIDKR